MATTPNRTPNPGRGATILAGRKQKPVGFGLHGHPFFNLQKYHQSAAYRQGHQGVHQAGAGQEHPNGSHPGLGQQHHPGFPMPGGFGGGPPMGGGHPPILGGAPGGYHGLDNILSILQKGINQQQLGNLAAGATGGHGTGVIGGMNGAFSGLSPTAVHFLATSGLLQAQAPSLQDTNGLSGDDLFKAQLMNNILSQHAQQNPMYQLHSGIDASFLTNALKNLGGAYAKGFNATGPVGMLGSPISA